MNEVTSTRGIAFKSGKNRAEEPLIPGSLTTSAKNISA